MLPPDNWKSIDELIKVSNIHRNTATKWLKKKQDECEPIDFKNNIAQKDKGKWFLNPEEFHKDYHQYVIPVDNDSFKNEENTNFSSSRGGEFGQTSTHETYKPMIQSHLTPISIPQNYVMVRKRSFYLLPIFWTAIVALVIIITLIIASYLYRKEIIRNNDHILSTVKQNYESKIESLNDYATKKIADVKTNTTEQINVIKESGQKVEVSLKERITELKQQIKSKENIIDEIKKSSILKEKSYDNKINNLREKLAGNGDAGQGSNTVSFQQPADSNSNTD